MAGIYSDNARPESAGSADVYNNTATEEKTGSQGWGKFFKCFSIVASIALAAELIWFLGITPFRPFSKIEVNGSTYYERGSLLQYAGITPESSYIFTDTREVELLIAALPQIESAKVFKRFPGGLEINLEGRTAAALAYAETNGVTVPVVFDRHGVVFQIGGDGLSAAVSDLPVISGIEEFNEPALGTRVSARYLEFLEGLDSIRINAPELLSSVSEINIERKSTEGFDLTVYLIHHNIKVLLSALNEDILRYTLLMADVLAEDPEIDLIDFRGAFASYYQKGGSL